MAKQVVRKQFNFKMVKAPDFKTVNIDGIYGGLTVKRNINMNFFVDAPDLPKNIVHEIGTQNKIGNQLPPEAVAPSSIREMPFGVTMDLTIAKLMVVWLNEKIKEAEKQVADLAKSGELL